MQAKILIKRHFKSSRFEEIAPLLNDMRAMAMKQPGYVSGITLTDPTNANKRLVISTWQRIEDWQHWKAHPERQKIEAMIEMYQQSPTEYEAYVVGMGSAPL